MAYTQKEQEKCCSQKRMEEMFYLNFHVCNTSQMLIALNFFKVQSYSEAHQ